MAVGSEVSELLKSGANGKEPITALNTPASWAGSDTAADVSEDELVAAAQEEQDARDATTIIKDVLEQYGLGHLAASPYYLSLLFIWRCRRPFTFYFRCFPF